ncbi:SEFIR domain-containing protein [Lentzea sp.]|uniref:SEFIR domain-containing protein n=1 Tax=Lentzea sp. TaxID=56099 RepID=UPI002ED031BA
MFVAYTHDSQRHKDQVLALATLLTQHGVRTELDQWAENRPQDWYAWAHEHITGSDYTIIVASPQCKIAGDGRAAPAENRGAQSEMSVIRDLLQGDRAKWRPKLLAVVLPGGAVAEIPDVLQPNGVDHYEVDELSREGVDGLLRVIFNRPRVLRPALGQPPSFSQLDPSSLISAPARSSEPNWRVLPADVEVLWRDDIEALDRAWPSQWPGTLEVHVAPVGDARIPMSRMLALGEQLALYAGSCGILDVRSGVDATSADGVVRVSSRAPHNAAGGGMAVLRTGQRSAWMTLPEARIGRVLIRDDAVRKIQLMLAALAGLGPALPATVVPTAGIAPVGFVRRGEVQDLTSSYASMPMHDTPPVRLGADESLTSAELVGMVDRVAIELADRIIAKFPAPGR